MRILRMGLGILDLISFLVISFHYLAPKKLMMYTFLYLLIKGLFFVLVSRDFASYLDMACGLYIIFLYFGYSISFLTVIFSVYLAQKAVLTLIFARI